MKDLERKMKIKEVKKPGQYFLERHVVDKNNNKTVTKANEKLLIFMTGRCPSCNNLFFSDYDPTIESKKLDCSNKECSIKFLFEEGCLKYEDTPGKVETDKDKEVLVNKSENESGPEQEIMQQK
jgi:hypothetical protein